jgi:hypothetical protein
MLGSWKSAQFVYENRLIQASYHVYNAHVSVTGGFTKLLVIGRLTAVTGLTGPVEVSGPDPNPAGLGAPVTDRLPRMGGRLWYLKPTGRCCIAIWARRKLCINSCNSLVLWTAMRIMGCNPTGEDG